MSMTSCQRSRLASHLPQTRSLCIRAPPISILLLLFVLYQPLCSQLTETSLVFGVSHRQASLAVSRYPLTLGPGFITARESDSELASKNMALRLVKWSTL